jgi:hypothetical protein
MYIANYPEDSVLRRHCEAAAALDLQDWLARGPTDAVLLRHWNQLRSAAAAATPSPTGTRTAGGAQAAAPGVSRPAERGGFFAWLGALFRR